MAEHKEKAITEDIITEDTIIDDPVYAITDSPDGKHKVCKKKVADWGLSIIADTYSGTKETDAEKKRAAKALANHLWYLANKARKREYNEQYYQQNIDYWRKRYNTVRKERDDTLNEFREVNKKLADSVKDEKLAKMLREQEDKNVKEARRLLDNEVDIYAKNMKRAYQEYQEFLDSQKKMSFGEAWEAGTKSIASAGKNFINKLLRK